MKDSHWGGGDANLLGVGVMDLAYSHFWAGTYGKRKELGGVGGGTEAPALLNYVWLFKKVYIH